MLNVALRLVEGGEMDREKALDTLRNISGQDFGNDIPAWIRWAKSEGKLAPTFPDDGRL